MAQSGKDLLKRIQPTRRVEKVQLCLRPDLLDRWEEKTEALSSVSARTNERLGSGTPREMVELAEEIEALEQEMEDCSPWFTMEQMDKPDWQAICDANPPRDEYINDQMLGYNPDAVLDMAVETCLVDPVFEHCYEQGCEHKDCGTWEQLQKRSHSEWQELRNAVNRVNAAVVDLPKSPMASLILQRRAGGSASPDPGE